jgi:hypothetical protein
MPNVIEIQIRTKQLLEMQPSPAAALRLRRDVLQIDPHSRQLESGSLQARHLIDEQREDGSWGAFHSRDTSSQQRIATTEIAVERAICLGFEGNHPILERAREYILSMMHGKVSFPDRHEKNDRWPTGMRMFLASTLAMIDPFHEILDEDRSLWCEIARRSFQSGAYSQKDEILAHASLTGASVKDSYLTINNRYALNILGSGEDMLPVAVEESLLAWLWRNDRGIGYLDVPLGSVPSLSKPGRLDRWFRSLELLTSLFPRCAHRLAPWIDWIWSQQEHDGFWDFGPRSPSSVFLPFADDWRSRERRRMDWSTRVLLLAAGHERANAISSQRKD